MLRSISVWLAAPVILAAQTISFHFLGAANNYLDSSNVNAVLAQNVDGTEVGLGWSENSDPKEAVKEALSIALDGKKYRQPQIAIIFGSGKESVKSVLSQAKAILGDKTKIFGGVTDPDAVVNSAQKGNRGYLTGIDEEFEEKLKIKAGGFVVMTITSDNIAFGASSADVTNFASLSQAARSAAQTAVHDTGKHQNDLPKVVLLTSGIGEEDKIAAEISEIVGKGVLILGGTQKGNKFSVFSADGAYDSGISIGLIYTKWPLGCNLVQLAYNKLKKPDAIDNMFGMRRVREDPV